MVDTSSRLDAPYGLLQIIDQKSEMMQSLATLGVAMVNSNHSEADDAIRKHKCTFELAHPLQAERLLVERSSLLDVVHHYCHVSKLSGHDSSISGSLSIALMESWSGSRAPNSRLAIVDFTQDV